MSQPNESTLSSFDLRLAQWEEARGAEDTPPDSRMSRWRDAVKLVEQLEAAFGRVASPLTPGPSPPEAEGEGSKTLSPPRLGEKPGEGIAFGRFILRREIGRGGFGIVFLADDPQLGRSVALKVPRPELLLNEEGRQRFLHEGRAAATLDHPNIVAVYDAGEIGPVAYIAMAYCPGSTLAEWLQSNREPMPPRAAAELIATLADAMQHAHSRGVLHRDLKPGNVLLQKDEGGRMKDESTLLSSSFMLHPSSFSPKIADFGLARRIDDPSQTQTGAIVGTPQYMAPEQAAGRVRDIGTHTDIYALGAILYQLLTGRPPFEGTSAELVVKVQQDQPASVRTVRAGVPRDLETICLKCLAKEPAERYASAGELGEDLRRWLRGEPTVARPLNIVQRVIRWGRRRPAAAFAAGLSMLATVAIVVTAIVVIFNDRAERRRRDLHSAALAELRACEMNRFGGYFGRGRDASLRAILLGRQLYNDVPERWEFTRTLVESLIKCGDCCRGLNFNEEAQQHYRASEEISRQFLAGNGFLAEAAEQNVQALNNLIGLALTRGEYSDEVVGWSRDRVARRWEIYRVEPENLFNRHFVVAHTFEIGDFLFLHGRYSDASNAYFEAQRAFGELQHPSWAPSIRAAIQDRLALIKLSRQPSFRGPLEAGRLTNLPDFNAGVQKVLRRMGEHAEIARLSESILTHERNLPNLFRAARGYAWAAAIAPAGIEKDGYARRCRELLRSLAANQETFEVLRNDPDFRPYVGEFLNPGAQ